MSLFARISSHSTTYILVYVDDIIIIGSSPTDITSLIQQLNSSFALKDMGSLHYFLGIELQHSSSGGLVLSQFKYVQYLLTKAKMIDYKPCSMPMTSNLKLSSTEGSPFEDPSFYRYVVGSL